MGNEDANDYSGRFLLPLEQAFNALLKATLGFLDVKYARCSVIPDHGQMRIAAISLGINPETFAVPIAAPGKQCFHQSIYGMVNWSDSRYVIPPAHTM